jgi:Zn-dependent protease with chaperone function
MSNYLLHGGILALAWFLIVNIVMSVAVAAWAARTTSDRSSAGSAALWFAARVGPAAAALLFVAGVFVPSYWKYEPREVVEGFDVTLTALALGAACLFVAAGARGLRAWRSAARRTRLWMRTARPLVFAGTRIPAFEIDADTPIMALVGVLRPRLLVTRGLVAALTDEELVASVAHEIGHSRARDNLKRLLMRAAPDMLTSTSAARAIERRWVSASEQSADRMAASESPAARCALASALVKVARLIPVTPKVRGGDGWEPISTLVDGGEVVSRVERLLAEPPSLAPRRTPAIAWIGVLTVVAAVCPVNYTPLLQLVHAATEALVHSLP